MIVPKRAKDKVMLLNARIMIALFVISQLVNISSAAQVQPAGNSTSPHQQIRINITRHLPNLKRAKSENGTLTNSLAISSNTTSFDGIKTYFNTLLEKQPDETIINVKIRNVFNS